MASIHWGLLAAALFAHDLAAFRVHAAADLGGDGCRLLRRPALRGLLVGGPGWAGREWRGGASGRGRGWAVGAGLLFRAGRGGSPRRGPAPGGGPRPPAHA